ncbi:MAG: TIGR01777 family oxidoreductase [Candidatus Rokuibacteriota bacterium]
MPVPGSPALVAITGSHGLVGSALVRDLGASGYPIRRVARDPASGALDLRAVADADAVVHLAGENIAGGRWTHARKRKLRDSRVLTTRALAEALAARERPPRVLVSASGINCYGDRGDERLTEESSRGHGFLADLCREWEGATAPAEARGVRVVHLRIGMVLNRHGGALAKMLLPFRLGLGGIIGSGDQWMSWIALDDLVDVIRHALTTDALRGPLNAVAPEPVTNREFTRALARALRRPALLPVPAFAARLALGEMADALLLASIRVEPGRLLAGGYAFRHPTLAAALAHELGARA